MSASRLIGYLCFGVVLCAPALARAQVPAELRGQITDSRTARPIEDARIEIVGTAETARTGADGEYLFRGLPPREYTMRVRALGYAMSEAQFEISNGRATIVDVALEPPPAALAAVVVNAERGREIAGSTVFDRAAIESSGRRDLGELLRTTPGVVVTQQGGPGSASRVSIRGSGANEVLVLLDGVPINSAITGEADLSRIDLENVDRVVVLTGSQSARYGGRALAGVIDIQTRRRLSDLSALVRAGAWGEHDVAATVGNGRAVGSMRAGGSLDADYRTIDGDFPYPVPAVRGGGMAKRVNSDVTSRQAAGSLTLDGEGLSTAARASWEELSRGLAGSIVQPSTTGREGENKLTGGFDAQWHDGSRAWTFASDATHERETFADPAPPFGTAYDDTVNATALTASTTFTFDRRWLKTLVGAEARSLDVASNELDSSAPHWQRFLSAWANARTTALVDGGATELAAEGGARVDESSLIAGAVASPRVGVSATRGVVVASASLGSGYAPPSLGDQFFHEGVLVRANPNLRPERTRGDLEGRLAVHETTVGPLRLSAEGAVFRSDIDGMILWLPDFRFIWSPSNYDVHRAGWEASARASSPATRLDVQGTLNVADVTYAGGVLDGQVAYRPRTTGSVTGGFSPGRIRLELTNRYVGERRTVPGSGLNALAPYWISDATLTTTINRATWKADVIVGVENLFDQPASMLVDYPFPSRTWTLSIRVRRPGGRATP